MHRMCTARTPCVHRVEYFNSLSKNWSTFEALLDTVPWWRSWAEELWQGVRGPMGVLRHKKFR